MTPGTRLGPYEIVGTLGSGGMGEVYRARDSRLGRDVAIKRSAERFSDRFEREARAIAALNHPHICTVHDVGPDYLVMELVDGPTLADRIRSGADPDRRSAADRAGRSPTRCRRRTIAASSTAISNRRTSRSRPMGGSRSSTSAWPSWTMSSTAIRTVRRHNSRRRATAWSSAPPPTWRRNRRAARRWTSAPTSGPSASSSTKC